MVRKYLIAGAVALGLVAQPAVAQISDEVIKIGVLTDMSSLYSDINGPGAVVAVQMAIDDAGGTVLGKKIELIQADVQNKADVGTSIAGRWYSAENVDVILGAAASSSSLAVAGVAADKKKVFLATDPATSDLTSKACNAYTIHWVYDTVALANGTGSAVVKSGGKILVFPHRGLCLRPRAGARRDRRRHRQRRQRDRPCAASDRHLGLLRVPGAGAGIEGAGRSASPMPAATRSTRSSRPPSSASSRVARSSRDCWCSSPTCTASACRSPRACN